MCGIAGYTGLTVPGKLESMAGRMVHRGPDQDGFYRHADVNLCMRRLSIVDLSTGDQPKFNHDRTVALVFNGEIYNYLELRRELAEKGYKLESESSDTEVIAHLYDEYGIDFVSRLVGMFAIALFDHKTKDLFLIRDRLGKKPIYYEWDANTAFLQFASEFNTLSLDRKPATIDPESIAWYFAQKAPPPDRSIDVRVKRVPPAHYLRFNATTKELKVERYWNFPAPGKRGASSADAVPSELVDELESRIRESVRIRMRADVEVGSFLSGGIDSSMVVALASKETEKPLKTYCLVYNEEINHKGVDREFARSISQQFRTDHHEVLLTPEKLAEDLPKIVRQHGEPNCAVVSAWFIAEEMSKRIKVALSGDGADELFGSYFTHRMGAAIRDVASAGVDRVAKSLPQQEARFLRESIGPDGTPSLARLIDRFSVFSSGELRSLLVNGDMASRTVSERIKRELPASRQIDPLQAALKFDCENLLVNQVLNYSDLLSMAHSLEVRTPFLDHRIAEFAFGLDSTMKIQGNATKRILKEVACRHLPRELVFRPKEGFVEPAVFWIRKQLRDFSLSYLRGERFNRFKLLNRNYVDSLIDTFYESGDFLLGKKIWCLLMYSIWENGYGTE